jgi:hypothetical protein
LGGPIGNRIGPHVSHLPRSLSCGSYVARQWLAHATHWTVQSSSPRCSAGIAPRMRTPCRHGLTNRRLTPARPSRSRSWPSTHASATSPLRRRTSISSTNPATPPRPPPAQCAAASMYNGDGPICAPVRRSHAAGRVNPPPPRSGAMLEGRSLQGWLHVRWNAWLGVGTAGPHRVHKSLVFAHRKERPTRCDGSC